MVVAKSRLHGSAARSVEARVGWKLHYLTPSVTKQIPAVGELNCGRRTSAPRQSSSSPHNQPFRAKYTIMMPATTTMAASSMGYDHLACSSGMLSKFMP